MINYIAQRLLIMVPTLIGMPAYVGGGFKALGAKLITGFPVNVTRGIPRASGVIVLFDTTTGVPVAILDCRTIS